jgi:hypothetical protein
LDGGRNYCCILIDALSDLRRSSGFSLCVLEALILFLRLHFTCEKISVLVSVTVKRYLEFPLRGICIRILYA